MNSKMITGSSKKALLSFSFPLLAGSVFQNLYNICDTMVVGQILGIEALSAVGNSYIPMLVINSVFLGVSSGITILVSQAYGSQRQVEINECISSVHMITGIIGIGLAIASFICRKWLFSAMNISESILDRALSYWSIILIGIPFSAIYNFYSAIIKAKGNSKIPVMIIGSSCAINIFLDVLFVGFLGFGIQGAAAATVASQILSAGATVIYLFCCDSAFRSFCPNIYKIFQIFRLSITGIVQNSASAASMVVIQGFVNQYGVNAASAYIAAYKIESILTIPAVNLGNALGVFTGQNIGAKQTERAREGLVVSFKIGLVICAITMLLIWMASPILMFFIVGSEQEVIKIGVEYLTMISFSFPFCVSLYILTNFLRGAGEVAYPLFNTILELGLRTTLAFVLTNCMGLEGILLCRPISFIISTISLGFRYKSKKWMKMK